MESAKGGATVKDTTTLQNDKQNPEFNSMADLCPDSEAALQDVDNNNNDNDLEDKTTNTNKDVSAVMVVDVLNNNNNNNEQNIHSDEILSNQESENDNGTCSNIGTSVQLQMVLSPQPVMVVVEHEENMEGQGDNVEAGGVHAELQLQQQQSQAPLSPADDDDYEKEKEKEILEKNKNDKDDENENNDETKDEEDDENNDNDCCPICYEEFSTTAVAADEQNDSCERIVTNPTCGHVICRSCLFEYCQHAVSVKQIPIACPVSVPVVRVEEETTATTKTASSIPMSALWFLVNGNNNNANANAGGKEQSSTLTVPSGRTVKQQCTCFLSDDLVKNVLLHSSLVTTTADTATQTSTDSAAAAYDTTVLVKDAVSIHAYERLWKKYVRFQRMIENPDLTPCPLCEELNLPQAKLAHSVLSSTLSLLATNSTPKYANESQDDDLEAGLKGTTNAAPQTRHDEVKPLDDEHAVECSNCHCLYCELHSLAHVAKTCREYQQAEEQRQQQQQATASEAVVAQYTKPCSHCGARIFKFSGCDYVVCPACQHDMCFKCGTHVYLKGGRFFRMCSKCQEELLQQHQLQRQQQQRTPRSVIRQCCLWLCLPLIFVAILILVLLALLHCFLWCLCGGRIFVHPDDHDGGLEIPSLVQPLEDGTTTVPADPNDTSASTTATTTAFTLPPVSSQTSIDKDSESNVGGMKMADAV